MATKDSSTDPSQITTDALVSRMQAGDRPAAYEARRRLDVTTRANTKRTLPPALKAFEATYGPLGEEPKSSAARPERLVAPRKEPKRTTREAAGLPDPYTWQSEAFDAWRTQDRVGVVEAVTGAGKSMLGLMAAKDELADGRQVLKLVPTTPLQKQWSATLRSAFPGVRVAQVGGGGSGTTAKSDVVVAVVNSARDGLKLRQPGLLLADEVHRYGSPSNQEALDERFPRRMGLTATYERADDGIDEHLEPYFGAVCYRLGYRRAIEDDVLAGFRVALLPVELTPAERDEYDQLSHEMAKAAYELELHLGFKEPYEKFMKQVELIAEGSVPGPTWTARRYQKTMSARRTLLAETSARTEAFERLVPIIAAANRSLVFGERVDQAERFASVLNRAGVKSEPIHSDIALDERERRLRRFSTGALRAVCAPRVLDEGIDVPEADLGVVAASTRTRRQMIQRMGRVIRKKQDGREARFIILYVAETTEDPATGAHDLFLEEVEAAATDLRRFSLGWNATDVQGYFGSPPTTGAAREATTQIQSALHELLTRAKPNARDRAIAKDLGWDSTRVWAMRNLLQAGRIESQRPPATAELAETLSVPLADLQRWLGAETRHDRKNTKTNRTAPSPGSKPGTTSKTRQPTTQPSRPKSTAGRQRVASCNACGRPINMNGRCGCS